MTTTEVVSPEMRRTLLLMAAVTDALGKCSRLLADGKVAEAEEVLAGMTKLGGER